MTAGSDALGRGCGPASADLPEMVDVAFEIAGESLPSDFEWPLFREIARVLPWIAKTPRAGILPVKGPRTPEGGIMLTRRSRIVIPITHFKNKSPIISKRTRRHRPSTKGGFS